MQRRTILKTLATFLTTSLAPWTTFAAPFINRISLSRELEERAQDFRPRLTNLEPGVEPVADNILLLHGDDGLSFGNNLSRATRNILCKK